MESTSRRVPVAEENVEATDAWSGVLFDRFVQFKEPIIAGATEFSEAAISLHPPKPGDRVLDIGFGFGDTTQRLAGLVGPEGEAVGIDVSEPFVAAAIEDAEKAGVENVKFLAGDLQVTEVTGPFDYAFSRMGVMFFANPVAALRNVHAGLAPGGRFCATVWRRKIDNDWVYRAEQVVDRYLDEPEETDEPTCGPGPFSMANADTVSDQLLIAGFENPTFTRCDLPLLMGRDVDEAVGLNMALGPAAELIRMSGDDAERIRTKLEREIREVIADFQGEDGVRGPASIWIISADAPSA